MGKFRPSCCNGDQECGSDGADDLVAREQLYDRRDVRSNGSAAALSNVTNLDGSISGLILDVHKYLDVDNSDEHAECTTDNIADAFQLVADFLRQNGRQAMVSETGAVSTSSCYFCAQNSFLNQNSDVFLGYIAWAAGNFSTSYVLSLTPAENNGKFVDNALASQCVVAPWLNASNTATFISSAALSTVAGSNVVKSSSEAAATTGSGDAVSSAAASALVPGLTMTSGGKTSQNSAASVTQNSGGGRDSGNETTIASATPSANSTGSGTSPQSASGVVAQKIGNCLLAGSLLVTVFL